MYRVEMVELLKSKRYMSRTVLDFTFSISLNLGNNDFTVVTKTEAEDAGLLGVIEVNGWILDEDDVVVAYGVLTRVSIDRDKEETTMRFSGVSSLLRGAVISVTGYSENSLGTATVGNNVTRITAANQLGIFNNLIHRAQDQKTLPFNYSHVRSTGTTHAYTLSDGDFKTLDSVLSQYLERENISPIRWIYKKVFDADSSQYATCTVDWVNIVSSQSFLLEGIVSVGTLDIDASEVRETVFAASTIQSGGNRTLYFARRDHTYANGYFPVNRTSGYLEKSDSINNTTTLANNANNRANKTASKSINVTVQRFIPSNIGKIFYFPYMYQHYLYGVVTSATYHGNDTVELTLSNVVRDNNPRENPTQIMSLQTATPQNIVSLLNKYASQRGSNSVNANI